MDSARHNAFTLIEAMVTLFIIALLFALLMPALERSREAGRNLLCLMNLRGNGLATVLYAAENDQRLPPMFFGFSPGNSGKIIVNVAAKKAADAGFDKYQPHELVCPVDTDLGTVPLIGSSPSSPRPVVSFGYNIDLTLRKLRADQLPRPARTAVMFDGSMSGPGDGGKNIAGVYDNTLSFNQAALTSRHDGLNFVFADWHAAHRDQFISGMMP